MTSPARVVVAVPMTRAAARQKLRGVYRYVAEGHDWDIRQVRTDADFTVATVRAMALDGIDGCIVSLPNCHDALRELARTQIPSVAIEIDHHVFGAPSPRLSYLRTDNTGIGRAGAKYLRQLGMFRSYAFVPDQQNSYWAQARAVAFSEALPTADVRWRPIVPSRGEPTVSPPSATSSSSCRSPSA